MLKGGAKMYIVRHELLDLVIDPEKLTFEAHTPKKVWKWDNSKPSQIKIADSFYSLDGLCVSSRELHTGTLDGVSACYGGFPGSDLKLHAEISIERTSGDVLFSSWIEDEPESLVREVCWIKPFVFDADKDGGYTILSRMQGTLIPAKYGETIRNGAFDGIIMERDSYMPIWGQAVGSSSYVAIYETPFDALYRFSHIPDGDTSVRPVFIPQMRTFGYKRVMRYIFRSDGSGYVGMTKDYRNYLSRRGKLVSLEEKIARNPNVGYLIGAPIVHEGIAVHISPDSRYYKPEDPEFNDNYVTFDSRAAQLKALREKGVEKAYLHLDGWGNHGYDNLHPDPFPPHEAAGGADGMRRLSDTCRSLGYKFGIHDQYRDYYYDAPSFSLDNAVVNEDGSHPYCDVWYGGKHSYLCQALAPQYVRRNYDTFERLGIRIDGSYLDVFSVVALDRCFSEEHPLTREQSSDYRRECLDILTSRGIIPSSEETIDCIVPSLALCHHAPYFCEPLGSPDRRHFGIPVPLFNLVWHDCIVIPWFMRNGWGMPPKDWGLLHALLNGGTTYLPINAGKEQIDEANVILALHKKVAKSELLTHEFIGEGYRRQRTVFADGSSVEVDFDANQYSIN